MYLVSKVRKLYMSIVALLFTVLIGVSGCKNSNIVRELNNQSKLALVLVIPYKNESYELQKTERNIIKKLKEQINVDFDLKYTTKVENAVKLLHDNVVDIVLGIPMDNNYYDNYAVSNVYEERHLYCVTNNMFDSDNIHSLDLESTVPSSNLLEIDAKYIRQIYDRKGKSQNALNSMSEIKEYLNSGGIKNYLCYKEEALDIVTNEKNLRIYKLKDIEPQKIISLNNKKSKMLLDVINKVIN